MCIIDIVTFYCPCYFAAAPRPPTGVSVVDGAGCYTSVVSWVAPQPVCGVVVGNYSVRYQLRSGAGASTTVYATSTSVTLQDLVPNAEYTVSVAAINTSGVMSVFTEATQFELQGDLCVQLLCSCSLAHHTRAKCNSFICLLFSEPTPPKGVTFTVTSNDSAVVSWMASQSLCDDVIGNYSVRYQLKNASSYTTVYTNETRVVLQGLVPNAEYTVSVAAINSMGDMSAFYPFIPPTPMPAETSTQGKTHLITIVFTVYLCH